MDTDRGSRVRRNTSLRLSDREQMGFLRRLAALLNAGLVPDAALASMTQRGERRALREMIGALQQEAASGRPLTESLRLFPGAFSPLLLALFKAGEASGKLPEALEEGAAIVESRLKRRRTLQLAMIYPIIVLLIGLAVVTFLVVFVIPRFAEMFASLDAELPPVTRSLVTTSRALARGLPLAVLLLIILGIGNRLFRQTRTGRVLTDWLSLHLPVTGALNRKVVTAQFARVYGRLLEGGVGIVSAVRLAGTATGNSIAEQVLFNAARRVDDGVPLSAALKDDRVFLGDLAHELLNGEKTGGTDEALRRLAERLETEIKHEQTALMIIPIVVPLLLLGLLVGWIVLAIFVPWFQLPGLVVG